MGNGKSFYEEENIEQGIDKVIKKLNDFIGHTGYYEGCEKDIYSPMQEILNEFIKIDNSNSSNDVNILQKFEGIGSLEEIKKECSDSEDIKDYIDIFKDIVENSEKINEIKDCITKCNECLKDLKDIKLGDKSTIEIDKCAKKIQKYNELYKSVQSYGSKLKQYNEIINLEFPKDRNENKAENIETIKKFKKYCDEITKGKKFDQFSIISIKNKLEEIKQSVENDDWGWNRKEDKEQITNIDTVLKFYKNETNNLKYQDLAYKYRKIIENWISCFNELLASKEFSTNDYDYKCEKYKTILSYLQALDDNLTYYQNENKKINRFTPGFYIAKSKIPYTEDDKGNKVLYKEDKQENIIKSEDKKEIKEKIIKSRIEKKMWNVKINNKKLEDTEKSNLVITKNRGFIGDKQHGYKAINTTKASYEPYFSVNDIKQGEAGNCWLEATLKSMALKSPKKLLDLFPNHLKEVSPVYGTLLGNQITIKLYDYYKEEEIDDELTTFNPGKIKEMTVDATEINWNRGKAFWPSIIEKAIDKLIEKFHYDESKDYGKQISGNNGAVAHVILTGESSSINKVENNYKKTLNKLQEALQKSHAPTCGTRSDFGIKVNGQTEKEMRLDHPNSKEVRFLFSNHAYTLKAIHENEKYISETKIDLINPWGKKKSEEPKIKDRTKYNEDQYNHYENAVGKNEITVSLDEFITYFRNIYY